jgi:uncharacterized delta-60 repeat protein
MSILTKPINPLSANIEYEFELSVAELLVLVQSVTNSDYWEDTNNWRAVDFVYVNSQKQYQRIVFDLSTNELQVDFAFNQNSINGVFQCGRITVFGYVNDSLRIKRSFYDDEFDIVIVDGIDLGTTIVITSVTPPAFGTYSEGDVLTFTLNFSGLVDITGLSLLNEDGTLVLLEDEFALMLEDTRVAILVGSEIRYATYVSGSESANVVYEYVVQAGDQDLDGIEILSLDLNGGVIIGVNGESVNITIPTTDTSGVLIDNSAPDIIAPTITDILVSDGIYEDQDDIIFTVEFSENVLVSGSPVLTLDIGGVTRQAALLSSSLNQAVFSYTVEQPDNDNNGIEIVSLDNGVITDAALNFLDRTLPVVDTSNVFVSTDIIAPTILSITAVDGNYKTGDNLNFTATFSEPVVITGTPYLLVDIGGTQVQANMTSNNSADATFSYTVLAGQLDLNGVQVLSLDSAVITDNALNLLDRTLPAMDMSLVRVDAVAPSITSVSAPADGNYTTGQVISFVANFTENVVVTGTPFLQVQIGSSAKQFDYVPGGSGTNALTFSYTVVAGDLDDNGISFASTNIQVPSATIRDSANNNSVLSFTAPTTTGITVNNVLIFTPSYAMTQVNIIKQKQDGKFLVGGGSVNGGNFVIYNSNGTVDTSWPHSYFGSYFESFSNGSPTGSADVRDIEIDSSGNMYIGGRYQWFNGSSHESFIKFNSENIRDNSFNTNFNNYNNSSNINSIALESSGSIIIGKGISSGVNVARILSNGTPDNSFLNNIDTGFNAGVNRVLIQSDGKIIAAGAFSTFKGLGRNRIVRLNTDGTEDTSFYSTLGSGFNNTVRDIFLQTDGKILVAGDFTSVSGQSYFGVTRLNSNGSIDTSFNIGGSLLSGSVYAVFQQSNGSIVIGGSFSYSGSSTINNIARYNVNGVYDTSFTSSLGSSPFNNLVTCITQDANDRLLIGGSFTTFKGSNRNQIVRLNINGTEE